MRWRIISISLCLCIILGGIGFMAYRQLTMPAQKPTPAPQKASLPTVIAHVRERVHSTQPDLTIAPQADLTNSIGFPAGTYNLILPDDSALSGFYQRAANADTLKAIKTSLVNDGFSYIGGTDESLLSVAYFSRDDGHCQVTNYNALDIQCITAQAFNDIVAQAAPLMAAYANAYPPSGTRSAETPVLNSPNTNGYTTATMRVYDSAGLTKVFFYQRAASGWQVVNTGWYNDPQENGDIQPNCGAFASLDATKQAFAGLSCYNSSTRRMSTI